jgi:putative ABC transport system permease protein
MDTLAQDLRFAVRILMKSPGFTLVAVVCLALGIGANTTIFSVVNAVLVRPFPYADPDRIVALHSTQPANQIDRGGVSYQDYLDYREQSRGAFSELAAYDNRSLAFSGVEEPERVLGSAISASLFPLLGEKPALGRNFRDDEDRPGAAPVILLSHDLWMRRCAGDPGIIGRTVTVNGAPRVVVGVMAPRFNFPYQQQAWIPLTPVLQQALEQGQEKRSDRDLNVLARLAPGVSFGAAQGTMKAVAQRLAALYPEIDAGWGSRLLPLREELANDNMRLVILTMEGAVLCVLLIACANVANLLLARATARQREIAVRAAFGAGRGRIVRQLLSESVLIALAGAFLGVGLGYVGIRWMESAIPVENQPPYWMRFTIDGTVLLYILVIAVLTGILFGLAPALQAGRTDLHSTLQEGGRGAGSGVARNRLRSTLVVAEVALALVLLILASLFTRSFLALQKTEGGFSTARLLTMRIYLTGDAYRDDGAKLRRVEDVVRRLETVPGIEAVAVSNTIPLSGGGMSDAVFIEGRVFKRGEEPAIFYTGTTAHLFRALAVPVLQGRGFTDRESTERCGLALINQTFAKQHFGGDALGKRFRLKNGREGEWLTVIGVVRDFFNGRVGRRVDPSAYLPYPYLPVASNGLTVRTTTAAPAQATASVREAIRSADPNIPIYNVFTMEDVRQQGYWEYRMFGGMFSVFGGIALFLAAIGVYGVLSYSVSQRVREIGVRVALGARRADVLRLVVGQGVALALVGVTIGLLCALGATRVVSRILFGVTANDPLSFIGIALLLTAVAALASYAPASRAMAIDPLDALRNE